MGPKQHKCEDIHQGVWQAMRVNKWNFWEVLQGDKEDAKEQAGVQWLWAPCHWRQDEKGCGNIWDTENEAQTEQINSTIAFQ